MLFRSVASTISLTAIVGPVLMTKTFAHYAPRGLPGAPYLLACALLGLGIALLWWTLHSLVPLPARDD